MSTPVSFETGDGARFCLHGKSAAILAMLIENGQRGITGLEAGIIYTRMLPVAVCRLRKNHKLNISTTLEHNDEAGARYGRYRLHTEVRVLDA